MSDIHPLTYPTFAARAADQKGDSRPSGGGGAGLARLVKWRAKRRAARSFRIGPLAGSAGGSPRGPPPLVGRGDRSASVPACIVRQELPPRQLSLARAGARARRG